MRLAIPTLASLALAAFLVSGVRAEEKTLEGKIQCAKCHLKKEKECATVIVVKGKDDKEVVYYFDKAANGKYHGDTCKVAKEGAVTGVLAEEDGKKLITKVTKVEYDE